MNLNNIEVKRCANYGCFGVVGSIYPVGLYTAAMSSEKRIASSTLRTRAKVVIISELGADGLVPFIQPSLLILHPAALSTSKNDLIETPSDLII